MNERRSKAHIFVDILRLIRREGMAKPTHILYGANLSHIRLKKYLDSLQEMGFLEKTVEHDQTYFRVTSKGNEFVKEFKKVEQLSEAFGIEI